MRIHDHAFVVIGNNVRLGPGVSLLTEGHPPDAVVRRAGVVFAKPITIGDDVWIGANGLVLGGVTVGDGAVVAAGAVVIRDVSADTVVGGVPTKVLRVLDRREREREGAREDRDGDEEMLGRGRCMASGIRRGG